MKKIILPVVGVVALTVSIILGILGVGNNQSQAPPPGKSGENSVEARPSLEKSKPVNLESKIEQAKQVKNILEYIGTPTFDNNEPYKVITFLLGKQFERFVVYNLDN